MTGEHRDCKLSEPVCSCTSGDGPSVPQGAGHQQHAKRRIIVLGSGFGGTSFLNSFTKALPKSLRDAVDVVLVSEKNYHIFTPLLYQVATGLVDSHHILEPVCCEAVQRNFRMIVDNVKSIDFSSKSVELKAGRQPYDYLVIATGSASNDFGIEGVHDFALPLKSVNDGEKIRNRILENFHIASYLTSGDRARAPKLHYVIVGGGAAGIELSASVRDYLNDIAAHSNISASEARVTIIEAMDRLMPSEKPVFAQKCRALLEKKGVNVILGRKVRAVRENGIALTDGGFIETENVFWTAGIKPGRMLESLSLNSVGRMRGWLPVNGHLELEGAANVYVAGDAAHFVGQGGKGLPKTAVTAVEQGTYLGRYLASIIGGLGGYPQFVYKDMGTMLALGRHNGIARFRRGIVLTGTPAWLVWRIVHLVRITTVRNKVGVLFDWSFSAAHRRIMTQTV